MTNLLNQEFDSVYCPVYSKMKKKSVISNSCPRLQVIFDDMSFVGWITSLHEEAKDILRIVTKCILGYINKRVDKVIKHTRNLV